MAAPLNVPEANKEFNASVKGFLTEFSPLNFPEGASFEEDNFVLLRDGTRQRRQGIDFENQANIDRVVGAVGQTFAMSSYVWENAGGQEDLNILVVQKGNGLFFFDNNTINPSDNLLDIFNVTYLENEGFPVVDAGDKAFEFSVINGRLVVTNLSPLEDIFVVFKVIEVSGDIETGLTFTGFDGTLQVRDFWGVDDRLFNSSNPSSLTDEHKYNLLNQGWPEARILEYFTQVGKYPNNAEIWHVGKYTDVSNGKEVWNSDQVTGTDFGNSPAPKGRAIINAFYRGEHRLNSDIVVEANSVDTNTVDTVTKTERVLSDAEAGGYVDRTFTIQVPVDEKLITSLKVDADVFPSIKTVAGFAGRVFYGGVRKRSVTDAEGTNPDWSSTIFFSRVIIQNKDFSRCYQRNDPTSEEFPDLLDDDGGTITINEAQNIVALRPLGQFLLVFAENGIWSISGGEGGFSATSFSVRKIGDLKITNPKTIVPIENALIFWAKRGIYLVAPDQTGLSVSVQPISRETIQTFYLNIPSLATLHAVGIYDSPASTVRWLYNDNADGTYTADSLVHRYNRELVLDLELQAFYTNTIQSLPSLSPIVSGFVESNQFSRQTLQTLVTDSSDVQVTDSAGENIIIESQTRASRLSSIKYITLVENDSVTLNFYTLTFSEYINPEFKDWKTADGTGVDAPAKLITGYFLENDSQRRKRLNYLTTHFNRTETGFVDDGLGNLSPENPSGCKVRARWDFADSNNGGKFSPEFQAYRYTRQYIPSSVADTFDYGQSVLTTRNKIRGTGRALQLEFNTEEGKDCQLLGWAYSMTGNPHV